MAVAAVLDRYQRRHPWAAFPIAVLYKFFDDQGGYLAALITHYAFLSLFPLLLLLVTLLAFILPSSPALQQAVLGSALRDFPIIGTQLGHNIHSLHGHAAGIAVGLLGTLYGGIGVAQAGQSAANRIWAVPRNERPNPFRSRARSLLILFVVGTGMLVTTVLSGVATAPGGFGVHPAGALRIVLLVLSVAGNVGLFIVAFRMLVAVAVRTGDVLIGAVIAAVAWQVLQALGSYYLADKLRHATEIYGLFGLVLGLIAWIYLEAVVVVLCGEVNVVRARKLWPRALLTPFTDDVDLSRADERAYASYARSERFKGFEQVDVRFDPSRPPTHRDP